MRLPIFLLVVLGAMLVVGGWSAANGAGVGMIALRVIVTAIALQAAYFVLIFAAALFPGQTAELPKSKRSTSGSRSRAKNNIGSKALPATHK